MTIILDKDKIIKNIILDHSLIPIIEKAFISISEGLAITPPIMRLDIPEYHGEADVKSAYVKGMDSFAIKIAVGYFDNPSIGLPSSNGLMVLLDSKTGVIKCILLDEGYLTDIRTAVAGAISAKYLSNIESKNVGIIGAGMQAELQLESLLLVRKPVNIFIWARKKERVEKYISKMEKKINLNFIYCDNIEELCKESKIIVTTTPSTSPLIKHEWLQKGVHITAMGSDAEQKNELDPKILKICDLYVPDKQSQTSILGELNHAIKNNIIDKKIKFNELGDIIKQPNLGRKNEKDITVCDLTGTGVQDTAIARYAFDKINKKI
tara:strand:- start:2577 stop:3542 length:966 start_codon:yes stop_codon:yes gene_type:complete